MKKTLKLLVALSVAFSLMVSGGDIVSKVLADPGGSENPTTKMIIEPDYKRI